MHAIASSDVNCLLCCGLFSVATGSRGFAPEPDKAPLDSLCPACRQVRQAFARFVQLKRARRGSFHIS